MSFWVLPVTVNLNGLATGAMKVNCDHERTLKATIIPLIQLIGGITGLTIWHLQNIIINDKCKIGYNFSISAGVIIGQAKERAPEIGNNVMLMVNTSVLGASICDNVAIGAGGLVIKDIDDEFTVWAGSPAKKISNNYPEPHMEKGKGIFKKIEEE
ncbi:TPA: hypothetical protein SHS77_000258 [Raoultella planticola]|nr:hypothetical protein [Raoultella planticola]